MSEAKARIRWIDICKLLGMILVIWLHFGCPGKVDGYVHLFHMPVFFLLSGICLNTGRGFKGFALSRIKSLLVPYLCFGILFYLFWSFLHLVFLPERFVSPGTFLGHILWNNTDAVQYLWGAIQWFLPCLFFAELLFFLTAKASGGSKIIILPVCLASAVAAMYLIPAAGVRFPLASDIALVALAFVGIGYCLKNVFLKIGEMNSSRLCLTGVAAFAVSAAVHLLIRGTNMRMMEFGNPFLYLIGSTAGCFMMVCVSITAERILDGCGRGKLLDRALYLGKNTIILLYIHRLFDGIDKTVLETAGISFPSRITEYAYFAVMTAVFLIISYPVTRLIDRHLGFMLGRRNNK